MRQGGEGGGGARKTDREIDIPTHKQTNKQRRQERKLPVQNKHSLQKKVLRVNKLEVQDF